MEYLRVARIVKPLGLHGEMKIYSTTSFPEVRYKKGNSLFLLIDNDYKEITVKSHRILDSKFDAISFDEFNCIKEIANFSNLDLFVIKDESILNKDEYFYSDLIGLKIFNENKKELGYCIEIEEFPAQITLKIQGSTKIFYVPFNEFFIKKVDLHKKEIIIHEIEGLIWNLPY